MAAKYELTEKQKLNVDQEIRRLKETQNLSEVPINVRQGLFGNFYSALAVFEAFLDGDVTFMDRKEKIRLLQELRNEIKRLLSLGDASQMPAVSRKRRFDIESLRKTTRPRRGRRPFEMEDVLEPDPSAMITIQNMGYSERHAADALAENQNNIEAAIEWLIHNCH